MGCCESFSKILLIVFNVIFFIFGGVILGIGIWAKVARSNLLEMIRKIDVQGATPFENTSSSVLDTIAIVLIVLGTFTFITGFCGCCGAIKESQCLLYLYSFLVGVVVLAEIGVGIYAGVQQSKFVDKIGSALGQIITKDFNGVYYGNGTLFTNLFTAIMFELKCCGANNESDFQKNTTWQAHINGVRQKHPLGCCLLKTSFSYDPSKPATYDDMKANFADANCAVNEKTQLNTDGCVPQVINLIRKNLGIVIGCCVGLGLFEILCIVFACCVARRDN